MSSINKFEVNGQEVLIDDSKLTELDSKVSNIYPLFTYINNIITDKESSYKIGYTGTDGTENTNNSEWRKFDVAVELDENYSLSGGRIMICFFDSNMNVISGIDSQSDRVITIPTSASLMRVSFQIANKDVLAIVKSDVIVTVNDLVSNPTERLNVYNKEYINGESNKIKKNSDEIATLMPMFDFSEINMFDTSKGVVGLFTTSTGSTASNANWRYTEYDVMEGISYSIYGGRNMVCFYVSPKNATVVSGGYESDVSRVVTVPNGATFMRVSSLIENDNEMCITQSDVLVSKEDTGVKPSNEFSVYSKREVDSMFEKVTVYTIGTDYNNIRIALEDIYSKKPSFKNRFVLRVPSGIYDIRSLFSSEELLTTKGVFVPPFTKVVGIGNPEDVVLTWFNE